MEKDFTELYRKLHAYDPSLGPPPTDEVAEAYEASLRDPSLRARHEEEQAFDAAFRAQLNALPVPRNLAGRIKQAARDEHLVAAPDEEERTHRTPGWWLHVSLLGSMAAAIVILTITFTFIINPFEARATPELNAMVEGIEASLDERGGMYFSNEYSDLVNFLSESDAPVPASLPRGIATENSFACRKVTVDNTQVAMLCFKRDDATFHLFTFDRQKIPRQADVLRPIISEFDNNRCATWTDQDNIYVLATDAPRKVLLSAL